MTSAFYGGGEKCLCRSEYEIAKQNFNTVKRVTEMILLNACMKTREREKEKELVFYDGEMDLIIFLIYLY